jgi:hypothetical protein
VSARRVLCLELPIDSDEELAALEGALIAARATERSTARRRGDRLSFGYGTDAARETMNEEIDQAQRRVALLDRLLKALDDASSADQ